MTRKFYDADMGGGGTFIPKDRLAFYIEELKRGQKLFNEYGQERDKELAEKETQLKDLHQQLSSLKAILVDDNERLLCAAIWYKEQPTAKILPVNVKEGVVVAGMRHGHCIHSFVALTGKRSVLPECGEYTQGFITSKDRFVDRKEAMQIARESGQVTKQQSFEELYSEDLY